MIPWQVALLVLAFSSHALAMCDHFLLPPLRPHGKYKHARPNRPFYFVYEARIREMNAAATAFDQAIGKNEDKSDDDDDGYADENSSDEDEDE